MKGKPSCILIWHAVYINLFSYEQKTYCHKRKNIPVGVSMYVLQVSVKLVIYTNKKDVFQILLSFVDPHIICQSVTSILHWGLGWCLNIFRSSLLFFLWCILVFLRKLPLYNSFDFPSLWPQVNTVKCSWNYRDIL